MKKAQRGFDAEHFFTRRIAAFIAVIVGIGLMVFSGAGMTGLVTKDALPISVSVGFLSGMILFIVALIVFSRR